MLNKCNKVFELIQGRGGGIQEKNGRLALNVLREHLAMIPINEAVVREKHSYRHDVMLQINF